MTFHHVHLRIRLILGFAGLTLLAVSGSAAEFEQARFIAPPAGRAADAACPLFRKEFTLPSKPQSATLRIIGLGDYEVSLNGRRLVATAINQPWSEYEKTLYYRDFDVTPALAAGPNCLGVKLYNSFWHNLNPPAGRYNKTCTQRTTAEPYLLCAEISFTQNDGAVTRIGTDATWRLTDGPVVFSHIFGGEDFDARRQVSGWDQAGFDDRSWPTAREAASPMARLEPQRFPNIATFDHQKPVSIKQAQAPAEPAAFLYSFPQNMAAQLRVELEGGKAGDRVGFRCGEHKNAQDRLFGNYVVGCEVITDGRPLTRQWGSFYLGMQFVEVTGAVPAGEPNPLGLPVVRGMELVDVRAALPEAGTSKTSSDLYNGTHVYVIRALAEAGRSDVLHRVYSRDGVGSYGGILKKGLTSLPETWDAMMDGCQSLNHCMLGHVIEWYYGYVGGIRQPAGGIGWKKIIVAPNPGALTHAECTVDTPAGRVVSRWRVDGKNFLLEVEIPAGVEAVAILPSGARMPLRSGHQTLTEAAVPPTS